MVEKAATAPLRFIADKEDAGTRLDQAIAKHFADISRRRAKDLIGIGGVFVNRARVKQSSRMLTAGDRVELHLGSAEETVERGAAHQVELPPLDIQYEDDHLLVVNKPAGMITAPTPESDRGNLLWYLSARARQQQVTTGNARDVGHAARIYLVHRIDMPTSGILVFGKTDAANRGLGTSFTNHDIDRQYEAIALGHAAATKFQIESDIDGRAARTDADVMATLGAASHLRLTLHTGRTHQIRIHLARHNMPILGDQKYATPASAAFVPPAPRMMLHARLLGFAHPITHAPMRFICEPPPAFADYAAILKKS